MKLEQSLVLNCYFNRLFGASNFADLQQLREFDEGPAHDGQSYFFHALLGRAASDIRDKLSEYDSRVMAYEVRLAQNRRVEGFRTFKYFQYLALLYTEIFLDKVTTDPDGFLSELNLFRRGHPDFGDVPDFAFEDLSRLAFFMATGSGKTLLLHVNIWQVVHYLKNGRRVDALVRRSDGRREFDNILLITPGEQLSDQHLKEMKESGLDAVRLIEDNSGPGLFGPKIRVIEIHKLAEEPSAEGVSVTLDELGDRNLVIVDEGHKGTGSEARTWKTRQQRLSRNGFLLEYSATFAQAIGAAGPATRRSLLAEYGKAILCDYSYKYFYGDGYGKTFRVLNLQKARAKKAHDLMLGGLLVFYQQVLLYKRRHQEYAPYNVEKPLWVLLGTRVSKKERDTSQAAERERSDVAEVVHFIRRVLEEPEWAIDRIRQTITGESGFRDKDSRQDLFRPHVDQLKGQDARTLYADICRELFHGQGGLEVWELKTSGEIGLRVSASGQKELPYFAVVNIGDVPSFKEHLQEKLDLEVREDRFSASLFEEIGHPDSPIGLLIGAKKFIEGWSSWRVSSMGLLNIGKGEGSQVIQLFGRGIRLKGKDKSLKRSDFVPGTHPDGLRHLETLYVFGWNADHVDEFLKTMEKEDLQKELLPLVVKQKAPWPEWLWVPAKREGYDPQLESWVFSDEGPKVALDLCPRVTAMAAIGDQASFEMGRAGEAVTVRFDAAPFSGLIDVDRLRADLVEYKFWRNYGNLFISRQAVGQVLGSRCEVTVLREDASDPVSLHRAASQALKTYLDRFIRQMERLADSQNAVPQKLDRENQVVRVYRVSILADEEGQKLFKQIETLLRKPLEQLLSDDGEPLPRLHVDLHLFNPILTEGGKEWKKRVSIRPPALVKSEMDLVRSLRNFWSANHKRHPYLDWEVCLLRNLPKVGVGLYSRSGFYPDFILWMKHRPSGQVCVRLLDPHGLHHGGLPQNEDRFEALRKLKSLSEKPEFRKGKVSVDGFILAPEDTPLDQIPGAKGMTWSDLEGKYPLIHQEGNYISKLLTL